LSLVSEIKTFFRHCPSCGRRFHIKLVRKEKVGEELHQEELTPTESMMESGVMHVSPLLTPLSEGQSIIVDVEDFEYAYKCTHCGHQWSEMHHEEQAFRP
jgi:DNA-directed RNA polymerase subunit RPC12/RpoP